MFGNDEDTETRLKKALWKALDDSPFVMLGLQGVEDDRTRPMTAQVDVPDGGDKEDGGPIYFFASKTDGVGQDIGTSARAVATFTGKDHKLFAHIHGTLVASQDREVIERLWNPIIASWYKDGKDDPDLLLLRFDTERAEVWEANAGATLKAAALKALLDVDPGKEHSEEHKASVAL
ncbi:pyridoxamine 5'-phosphate oxidase family protein [Sphingomonas sp. HDW15A]|uniref:pyridoxamine 5'-phosphate oxidase family protein n=1 Tax=Sphingomonas sp. HDW15A TaxID=2714942 RepID=UPI00140BAF69|nr:pyridoxamine 5'-phosphate oxidase family protein [Sphingomonas sp. HDW15A]QIK96077.1 pyridoxamine 5'-phosphate oxidase family protein [Sphingomonas sp. HDW15A]